MRAHSVSRFLRSLPRARFFLQPSTRFFPSPPVSLSLWWLPRPRLPQMKMFGQISGRAQSGSWHKYFSVSGESRAITTAPHKSCRSGWSGSTDQATGLRGSTARVFRMRVRAARLVIVPPDDEERRSNVSTRVSFLNGALLLRTVLFSTAAAVILFPGARRKLRISLESISVESSLYFVVSPKLG